MAYASWSGLPAATDKAFFCTGTSSSSGCTLTTDGSLAASPIPADPAVENIATAINAQNPGLIGTQMLNGSDPVRLWGYGLSQSSVDSAVDGLSQTDASGDVLTNQSAGMGSKTITMTAYYVPCSVSIPAAGKLDSVPSGLKSLAAGTVNVMQPFDISNDAPSCSGGVVYLTFDTANSLIGDYVAPGSYAGDLSVTVQPLT